MSCSFHQLDIPENDIPSRAYSSEFVSKAMARLVQPIDPKDIERHPADLTVKCGSLDVEAHSQVLCLDSAYFKVICKGGFLEEYTQELRLPAEEEFLIRRLLCFCYTTGYSDDPYDDEIDPLPHFEAPPYVNRLHLNAQMYGVADKYDISGLKEKAACKFEAAVREMHPNRSKKLVEEIIEAIPCIYGSTPDGDRRLRGRAVDVVRLYWRDVQSHPGFRDLVLAVPEFFEERGILSSRLTPKAACFS